MVLIAPNSNERTGAAFRQAFGRQPTLGEIDRVAAYLERSEKSVDAVTQSAERQLLAWRGLCRVLLSSNEFVFVE